VTTQNRARWLLLLPLPVALASLLVGPSDLVRPFDVLSWLMGHVGLGSTLSPEHAATVSGILWDVRLPRLILAMLVGAALTGSGVGLQAAFRNPLVCPYVLGLASGAAFGAALSLATGWLPLQVGAFAFGLAAVALAYVLGRGRREVSTVSLVLSGVVVSGVFTALLTIVQYLADPFKLQTIVQWTMGNLHAASWSKAQSAAIPVVAGLAALFALRFRMNVLALGDEEARAAGLRPERERLLILIPATLAASAAVAVAGVIGLVGLTVPHMARMIVGPENRRLYPAAVSLGAVFLLLVDDASRSLFAFELPIGIFTTLLGAPVFVWLMSRARLGWEA
jgi:iron complex transport system permease protein